MKHDITKLCADSLRSHLSTKHGIKLKSGHAHEIVAAFFGYKSRIAMLADSKYPISNLVGAEFILLDPQAPLVNQRLKSLTGLTFDALPIHVLADGVYCAIRDDKKLLEKIHPSLHDLALFLAERNLQQHTRHWRAKPTPKWITNVEIKTTEAEVFLTVTFNYATDTGKQNRYSKVDIKLLRVAGNVGYGAPEIAPIFYSGQFRSPDFDMKLGE